MTGQRIPISKRTRFEVFKRDGFCCQYCGAHPPRVLLEVDHIVPVAEGGANDMDNLVTSCEPCNRGKGAVPLTVIPEGLAEKAARVAEAEEQLAGYSAVMQARRDRIETDAWRVVAALTGEDSIRRDWLQSIKNFVTRLGPEPVIEAAEIARGAKPWSEPQRFRYFCGICWNKVRELDG